MGRWKRLQGTRVDQRPVKGFYRAKTLAEAEALFRLNKEQAEEEAPALGLEHLRERRRRQDGEADHE